MSLCDYGNCDEDQSPYVVSSKEHGFRVRFCSLEHLVEWGKEKIANLQERTTVRKRFTGIEANHPIREIHTGEANHSL